VSWEIALKLGRVSNLPTVWTNMLAGIVLTGGAVLDSRTIPLMVALSLFYTGGMYLNDAFDAGIDAAERPERPIPSGRISRRSVFRLGFAMLGAGALILLWMGFAIAGGTGLWPALGGLALGAAIVFYDWHHKANALSPVVMGLCRMLVYVTAGLAFAVPLPAVLWLGAALLLSYMIGLTYVAKQETLGRVENLWPLLFLAAPLVYGFGLVLERPIVAVFWLIFGIWMGVALWLIKRRGPGDVPRAVVSLLAGISLFDAALIAGAGSIGLAGLAVLGFLLTVALQRYVPAT
jgi:4-hydroxybenzoate polyprenyltransferase